MAYQHIQILSLSSSRARYLQSVLRLLILGLALLSLSTMAFSGGNLLTTSIVTCYLLSQADTARAGIGWNSSTAIDSRAFPPLIEATIEHLIHGYEKSWFTSVDVVQVLILSLQIPAFG